MCIRDRPRGTEYRGIKVLGRVENLTISLPENKLDEIAITLGLAEYHKLEHIVSMCEKSGEMCIRDRSYPI